MKNTEIIELFHSIGNLKKIKRAGWLRHGIPDPETVADHSFRTTFIAMILGDILKLDTAKLMRMALIHDIAEIVTGDITPQNNITNREKQEKEKKLSRICYPLYQISSHTKTYGWNMNVRKLQRQYL